MYAFTPTAFAPLPNSFSARRPNDPVSFFYFDRRQPAEGVFTLPEGNSYAAESIDAVKLTRTPLPGIHSGKVELKLPGTFWGSLWFREICADL